jgi:hypothetical protein
MDDYNDEFTDKINKFKPQIHPINDNYVKLNDFFIDINRILQVFVNTCPNRNDLLSSSYFNKSALTQLLKFESYTPTDNGNLISASENCKFTIAEVKMEDETNNEKIFIKVVDYSSQTVNHIMDLILFDVLNSIIFEKLLLLPENQIYRNFIPKYKGSFVSYIKNNWNFNELNYKNSLSPYYYDNVLTGRSPYYRNKGIVFMSESIDIVGVSRIFRKYDYDPTPENKQRMIEVIYKSSDLYEFIKYLGLTYGFMHNDLHMDNVVYDITNKRLVLIDFGRVSFKKYISTVNPEWKDCLLSEYNKLNYNELLRGIRINDYTDLFKNPDLFTEKTSIGTDGNYFGVIFDLMTYTCNFYIRTLYFMYKIHRNKYDEFLKNFNLIMKTTFRNVDYLLDHEVGISCPIPIDELVRNYVSVRTNYISSIAEDEIKKHFTFLSEGLFYMSLYLHFIKGGRNLNVFERNEFVFFHFHILKNNLSDFKIYIERELRPFRDQLAFDTFISKFIPVSGGVSMPVYRHNYESHGNTRNKKNELKLFSKKEMKLANTKPSKELSLEETTQLYKDYFNDRDTYTFDYKIYLKESSPKPQRKSMTRSLTSLSRTKTKSRSLQ